MVRKMGIPVQTREYVSIERRERKNDNNARLSQNGAGGGTIYGTATRERTGVERGAKGKAVKGR